MEDSYSRLSKEKNRSDREARPTLAEKTAGRNLFHRRYDRKDGGVLKLSKVLSGVRTYCNGRSTGNDD